MLAEAAPENLKNQVYNVTSFSFSAQDFKDLAQKSFPGTEISFKPDPKRQAIVDTWPAEVDDSAARRDWDWKPQYNFQGAWQEYLLENISKQYDLQ